MVDDLVKRLREHIPATCAACDTWGQCGYGEPCDCRCHMNFCQDAAATIERLRAAGDALAKQITRPCRCVEAHDGAINETCAACAAFFDWQEARRG